jgi:hypothetical protein
MASIRRLPGQSPPQPRKQVPWGRVALGVLAVVVALYGWAWWRALGAVDAELKRWSFLVSVERGAVVLGPTGRIGIRDIVVRGPGASADGPQVKIGSVTLASDGGLGAFGRLLAGTSPPSGGPARLLLRRVVALPGAGAEPFGLVDRYVIFPFDFAGCGAASAAAFPGFAAGSLDADFTLQRSAGGAEVRLRATSAGLADVNVEVRLDEVGSGDWATALRSARLRGARAEVTDRGFAAARNQHCASTLGVRPNVALDRHIDGVREWFAGRHAEPAAPLFAVYRRFAAEGGTLEINLRPRRPLPLADFGNIPLRDFSLHFGGTARIAGMVPATLALSPTAMSEREPSAIAAAVDAPLIALSAAAEVAATKPAEVPTQLQFRPGQSLDYEKLESIPGAMLSITSTLGVTRRGRLVRYTRVGIELELDAAEGGFRLSMPRDTIREIVLLANPPLEAAPAGRS